MEQPPSANRPPAPRSGPVKDVIEQSSGRLCDLPERLRPREEVERIPADILEAKRSELLGDESVQKKPEAIRGQIVDGQLKKWFGLVCLLDQPFRDTEMTVRELITTSIATIGENIVVRRFARFELGEEQ